MPARQRRSLFAEAGKALRYDFRRTADSFSTQYLFSIWNIDLRFGLDKLLESEQENVVSFVFLAACSELAMNNHRYSIESISGDMLEKSTESVFVFSL